MMVEVASAVMMVLVVAVITALVVMRDDMWVANSGILHTLDEMDPGEPENISIFDAFEYTHACPQRYFLKDFAY